MAWVDDKTRLGTLFDYVRFWKSVTVKDTDGKTLIEGEFDKVKLSKYRSWYVVRVDGTAITVSPEEVDAEKVCLPKSKLSGYRNGCYIDVVDGCYIDAEFYKNSGMFVQN